MYRIRFYVHVIFSVRSQFDVNYHHFISLYICCNVKCELILDAIYHHSLYYDICFLSRVSVMLHMESVSCLCVRYALYRTGFLSF